MFRDVPGCSGMFRNVPECSMFRVLSTAAMGRTRRTTVKRWNLITYVIYFYLLFFIVIQPNKGLTANALSCSQNNDHRSTSNMTRYRFWIPCYCLYFTILAKDFFSTCRCTEAVVFERTNRRNESLCFLQCACLGLDVAHAYCKG